MTTVISSLRRLLFPAAVFVAVFGFHYLWRGIFPENDLAQNQWVSIAGVNPESWFERYVATQSYWLGYSYALSLTFAVYALRRYREERSCAARNMVVGGVTLSGFLAVVSCYLVGCCGSPMLAVYLTLFGAVFLPFTKPLIAGLTTITIVAAWLWMLRRQRLAVHQTRITKSAPVSPSS